MKMRFELVERISCYNFLKLPTFFFVEEVSLKRKQIILTRKFEYGM